MYEKVGVDLGASRAVVAALERKKLSVAKTIGAFRTEDGAFLGIVGSRAFPQAKKESGGVSYRRIFENSTLVTEYTRDMLVSLFENEKVGRALFSIPCGFNEVEETALVKLAVDAGAEDAYLIYAPLAALIGNGLDLSISAVVVDIGASCTNMLALCHGRMIYKKTFSIGGDHFDAAIAEYIRKKHKVLIDAETAEAVKIQVGTVWVGNEKRTIEIHGSDLKTKEFCTVRVSSEEMFTALEEPMASLIDGVCRTVTKIPADCVQEVFDTGILLSGGGCLLEGIDKMISGVTGINTTRLRTPRETVAMGLSELLSGENGWEAAGTRNISRHMIKRSAKTKGGDEK